MSPGVRKGALILHAASSVGLSGSVASFLVLAIVALRSVPAAARPMYLAMEYVTLFAILPLAGASLLTGIIQSLGTRWGLVRHWWVLIKLGVTTFAVGVLSIKVALIREAASIVAVRPMTAGERSEIGLQLAVHAAGGLAVLLIPLILSVYKPRGATGWGAREARRENADRVAQG